MEISNTLQTTPQPERQQSPAEKLFNSRIRKVRKLKDELGQVTEKINYWQKKYDAAFLPLIKKLDEAKSKLVIVFWNYYQLKGSTTTERKALKEVLDSYYEDLDRDIIGMKKKDHEALHRMLYGESIKDTEDEDARMFQSVASEFFSKKNLGVDIDFDFSQLDPSKPESLEQLREQIEIRLSENEAATGTSEPVSTKKSSKAELEKKAREDLAAKSIRGVFMRLAKMLHPDMISNERERAEKEEFMKQATVAYESKDLFSLLQIELHFLEDLSPSKSALTSEVLAAYNKVLLEQIDMLKDELDYNKSVGLGSFLYENYGRTKSGEYVFQGHLYELKSDLTMIEDTLWDIKHDPSFLKTELSLLTKQTKRKIRR